VFRLLDGIPGLGSAVERLRAGRTARDYEIAWARSRGSGRVLATLDERALNDPARADITEEVRAFYQFWHENARARLDQTEELFRKVPFFQSLPSVEFASVAARLRRRTAPAGEVIVRQGAGGDSLYLVARGVIRVSRQDGGSTRDLATLMAGDFFGETALLH